MSLLLLFVDGIGIGGVKDNPLLTNDLTALSFHQENWQQYDYIQGAMAAIDACLGIEGLPQSATGQTSIFSGINAAKEIGKHQSGMPNRRLRELLRKQSIFISLLAQGVSCHFINAFTPVYLTFPIQRMSASTLHMLYAGLKPSWIWQIERGESLFQDFTNKSLVDIGFDVPNLSPQSAGEILANATTQHDFSIYEYFLTDAAGHARIRRTADQILQELDSMIVSLLNHLDLQKHTVLLCSDHGNIEDDSERTHTRAQVPLIAWGANRQVLIKDIKSITGIKGRVENYFGIS